MLCAARALKNADVHTNDSVTPTYGTRGAVAHTGAATLDYMYMYLSLDRWEDAP